MKQFITQENWRLILMKKRNMLGSSLIGLMLGCDAAPIRETVDYLLQQSHDSYTGVIPACTGDILIPVTKHYLGGLGLTHRFFRNTSTGLQAAECDEVFHVVYSDASPEGVGQEDAVRVLVDRYIDSLRSPCPSSTVKVPSDEARLEFTDYHLDGRLMDCDTVQGLPTMMDAQARYVDLTNQILELAKMRHP